jgi:hypothetical protein
MFNTMRQLERHVLKTGPSEPDSGSEEEATLDLEDQNKKEELAYALDMVKKYITDKSMAKTKVQDLQDSMHLYQEGFKEAKERIDALVSKVGEPKQAADTSSKALLEETLFEKLRNMRFPKRKAWELQADTNAYIKDYLDKQDNEIGKTLETLSSPAKQLSRRQTIKAIKEERRV